MPLYENGVNVANKFLEAVVAGYSVQRKPL